MYLVSVDPMDRSIDVKNLVKLRYDKTYFAYFLKISWNGSNQYVIMSIVIWRFFKKSCEIAVIVKNLYYSFVSVSPTCSEHIYEEIPERTKAANEDRPLPPIPETSTNPEDQNTKVWIFFTLSPNFKGSYDLFWIDLTKLLNLDFQVQFSTSKRIQVFMIFF